MAKWGEGDPRWIVEERPDATNVNNWHWTEKNAGPWSKDRLKELLLAPCVSGGGAECQVTEVERLNGEASANNRKGKLIFFYEWDIVLKWEGRLAGGSGEPVKGEVAIPNLSEENDINEIDITVSLNSTGEEAERLKQIMHSVGRDTIRQQLAEYVRSLKQEFSKGLILPKKGEGSVKPDNVSTITSGFNKKINMEPVLSRQNEQLGCKIDTRSIDVSENFQCRAQEFYDAMTRIEMVTAFTRGHVGLELEVGGKFSLFGGNVSGEFRELVPPKRIVQLWRYKQWPAGHFSEVTFDIVEKEDHTEVKVKQVNVPATEVESTKENWQRYYFDSIKRTFGFGAFL